VLLLHIILIMRYSAKKWYFLSLAIYSQWDRSLGFDRFKTSCSVLKQVFLYNFPIIDSIWVDG